MLNVTFVLYEHMLATSVTLPMEQLRAAESLMKSRRKIDEQKKHQLNIRVISANGEPVKAHTGIILTPDSLIEDITNTDIIYLPALWRNPKPVIQRNQPITEWLQRMFESGSLIAGVGTGCCFMAEAGLLDGRPATTHWHFFDKFQQWYPQVKLKRQYFITESGNLFCTGSVNSLADLTVHFIQRFFSSDIATHVERHFFHEIRRAYDSDQSYQDTLLVHHDEDIIQTQIWLKANYEKTVVFKELAKMFGMSERSFMRRFKAATGITPLRYLQKQRMEMARDLLQSSNLSIHEIMDRVGYHDHSHFSNLFSKHFDTTPKQYRATVRAKLFKVDQ